MNSTVRQLSLSVVIGLPIAWKVTDELLSIYSERIELHWWHYALPVLVLVSTMFATVTGVLWRATKCNPVETLKHE